MRKSVFLFASIWAVAISGAFSKTETSAHAEAKSVYIGGMPAGFCLSAGGAQVIGLCNVITCDNVVSPAEDAGIKVGDIIQKAQNINVSTIGELNEIIAKTGERDLELTLKRGDNIFKKTIKPVKDKSSGKYRIGVLIRDKITGIGTVSYIEENGNFGALGHAVVGEHHEKLSLSDGETYKCSIIGVAKGQRGRAGELRGMFLNETPFGTAQKISSCGIFGNVSEDFFYDQLSSAQVAKIDEVKIGTAYIYSTVCGVNPQKYTAEIVKVDRSSKSNKNFVIKITDKDLIAETGGIVQGMSGSPILQGKKIIGAITHVFVNDPTRGYGIDINTMLEESKQE